MYLAHIFYTGPIVANFVLKFAISGYHGNRDRSGQSLNDTLKLPAPDNPLLGTSIWVISLMQAEL